MATRWIEIPRSVYGSLLLWSMAATVLATVNCADVRGERRARRALEEGLGRRELRELAGEHYGLFKDPNAMSFDTTRWTHLGSSLSSARFVAEQMEQDMLVCRVVGESYTATGKRWADR